MDAARAPGGDAYGARVAGAEHQEEMQGAQDERCARQLHRDLTEAGHRLDAEIDERIGCGAAT